MDNKIEDFSFENKEKKEKIKWKEWRVGVMGASSDKNITAKENGHEIGRMLAENGYDAVNGGYAVGGMQSTAEGYQEVCRARGMSDKEIEEHFTASVMSEEMIGKKLIEKRQHIKPAEKIESDSLTERMGNIINSSDATIILPGGTGTHMESLVAAQDEWFREQKSRNEKEKMQHKPIIIIDDKNTLAKMCAIAESDSPKTLNTLTHRMFIVNSETGKSLKDDPVMQEKIKSILDFYYLNGLDNPSEEQQQEKKKILKKVSDGAISFERFRTVVKNYQEKFDSV